MRLPSVFSSFSNLWAPSINSAQYSYPPVFTCLGVYCGYSVHNHFQSLRRHQTESAPNFKHMFARTHWHNNRNTKDRSYFNILLPSSANQYRSCRNRRYNKPIICRRIDQTLAFVTFWYISDEYRHMNVKMCIVCIYIDLKCAYTYCY